MSLYHFELGFPRNIKLPGGTMQLVYSQHALTAAVSDRYSQKKITLPTHIDFTKMQFIEIEVLEGALTKVVVRGSYSADYDLVFVIIPYTRLVKTVWLNACRDTHRTLDRGRYVIPR